MVKKKIVFSLGDGKIEVTIMVPMVHLSLFMKSLSITRDPYKALEVFNDETKATFDVSERKLTMKEWGDKMKQFKGINRRVRRLQYPPKEK